MSIYPVYKEDIDVIWLKSSKTLVTFIPDAEYFLGPQDSVIVENKQGDQKIFQFQRKSNNNTHMVYGSPAVPGVKLLIVNANTLKTNEDKK